MEEEAGAAKGKERRVTFRMEGGDYDALCERCERAGLSKSEYLRYLVRIPPSTEANAGDEHRILVDRKALWAMSRELTKWGYHTCSQSSRPRVLTASSERRSTSAT